MLDLINRNENKTMTSLEIAEITGKKHRNILSDIRDEISKLGVERGRLIFQQSYYTNLHNKEVRAITQQFKRNENKFKLGKDYYIINRKEILKSQTVILEKLPPNLSELVLFTEKGRKFIYGLLKRIGVYR